MSFRMLVLVGLLLQNSFAIEVGAGEWKQLANVSVINGEDLMSLEYFSDTGAVGTFKNLLDIGYSVGFTNDGGKTWQFVDDASTCTNSIPCPPASDYCLSTCIPLESLALDSGTKVVVGGFWIYINLDQSPCDFRGGIFFGNGTASKYVDNIQSSGSLGFAELLRGSKWATGDKVYAMEENWLSNDYDDYTTTLDSSSDGGATWKLNISSLPKGAFNFDLRHDGWYMMTTNEQQSSTGRHLRATIEDTVRKVHSAGGSKKQLVAELVRAARKFRRTRLEGKKDVKSYDEYGNGVKGSVYRSLDFGKTWTNILSLPNISYYPTVECASGLVCYVSTDDAILQTTNAGSTWDVVFTPPGNDTDSYSYVYLESGWDLKPVSATEVHFTFLDHEADDQFFSLAILKKGEDTMWNWNLTKVPPPITDNDFYMYESFLLKDGRHVVIMLSQTLYQTSFENDFLSFLYTPNAPVGSSDAL